MDYWLCSDVVEPLRCRSYPDQFSPWPCAPVSRFVIHLRYVVGRHRDYPANKLFRESPSGEACPFSFFNPKSSPSTPFETRESYLFHNLQYFDFLSIESVGKCVI